MTTPISSHATMLSFQATPGGSFSDVAELGDLTPPGLTRNEFDATVQNRNIDSFVLGVIRRTPITFPINWIPTETTHGESQGLYKLMKDNTLTGFKITFPDATVWVMSGQVKDITPAAPVDGKLSSNITIRCSGLMTINGTTYGS